MVAHAGFPGPLAHLDAFARLVRERQRPCDVREGDRLLGLARIPLHRRAHGLGIGLVRGRRLAGFLFALAAVAILGAGQHTDHAVAGAVGDQRGGEARLLSGLDVPSDDSRDARALFLNRQRPRAEEKPDILLGLDGLDLACVLIIVAGLRIATAARTDLAHHIAQPREGRQVHASGQMHPHLRAVVAAEHRAVLDQRHRQPEPRRRDRHADAGDAAAGDDQIHRLGALRSLDRPHRTTVALQFGDLVLRRERGVGREDQRIATAVETGQVVQRQPRGAFFETHMTRLLPRPLVALRAQHRRQRCAVNVYLELAWRVFLRPERSPVARAHQHAVGAALRHLHGRRSVRHRRAQSVRHQKRRTHLIHELLVHHPAAFVRKGFRLHKQRRRLHRPRARNRNSPPRKTFHHVPSLSLFGPFPRRYTIFRKDRKS